MWAYNVLEFLQALIEGAPLNQWFPCDVHGTMPIEPCIELIPAQSGVAEYPV